MTALNVLRLTAQTDAELEIGGDGITWDRVLTSGELTGYAWVRLKISEKQWLRIDAEPRSSTAPPKWHGNQLPRESKLEVDRRYLTRLSNDLCRLTDGALWLKFHWRNPLTPAGEGLWLVLTIGAFQNEPRLGLYVKPTGDRPLPSSLFYALKESPLIQHWTERPFKAIELNPKPEENLSLIYFSSLGRATVRYTRDTLEKECFGRLLRDRAGQSDNDAWLADVGGERRDVDFGFAPAPLDVEREEIPLVARFQLEKETTIAVGSAVLDVEPSRLQAGTLVTRQLQLQCARRYAADGMPQPSWLIDWHDVPGEFQGGMQQKRLTFEGLWPVLTRHYPLGMAAARSRNRLTFAPTGFSAAKAVTLRFDYEEHVGRADTSHVLRLRRIDLRKNELSIRFGGAIDSSRRPLALSSVSVTPSADSARAFAPLVAAVYQARPERLLVADLTSGKGSGNWVIGAVALDAKQFEGGQLTVTLEPDADLYGQAPVGIDIDLRFSGCTLAPASQDPEAEFEVLSGWLERERPIALSISDGLTGLRLHIKELANARQSRLMRLGLSSPVQIENRETDVVVLDPSPLTVARVVSEIKAPADTTIAEYTDDNEQPAEWVFASDGGWMQLVAPPQAIGEEMIKGRLYSRKGEAPEPVPRVGKPFDFRLAAPTHLKLDRTDIDTARTLAPWTLRRLLSQRRGVVGVKLDSAEFELLYGLRTRVESQGLRIATLEALIGRVPFADELLNLFRAEQHSAQLAIASSQKVPALQQRFARRTAEWIRDLLYYPSAWPVFRDFTHRQRLALSDGVQFTLRPTRQNADPFDIDRFAIEHPLRSDSEARGYSELDKADTERLPLRGGVDWPFQSREIYRELRTEQLKPAPVWVPGSVEGLVFGTLGGTGEQTAAFCNGKTIVISSTTHGRLNSLTLIRVGRIAMLWNHARHVIVYERTSRTAPRYAKQSDLPDGQDDWDCQTGAFDGYMALRKVREYVEITQPRRTYPDVATDRPISGPFVQSTFESVVIPVKASWGRDIADGWIMPLHGPTAPEETKFFPLPRIFLEFARAADKGEGRVAQQVKSPAQLLFFTSTRPQDSGDTDAWPAWPDIDYPTIARPASPPRMPFRSSFAHTTKQPDAARADFGHERFTVDLLPAEEAVNLMHGRSVSGVDARMFNVSLARGRPRIKPLPDSLHETVGREFGSGATVLADGIKELLAAVKAVAATAPSTPLADQAQLISDASALLGELQENCVKPMVAAVKDGKELPQLVPGWQAAQARLLKDFDANASRARQDWGQQLAFKIDRSAPLAELKRQTQASVESVCEQACRRMDEVAFVPEQALEAADAAIRSLQRRLDQLFKNMIDEGLAALSWTKQRYFESASAAGDLDRQWRTQLRGLAERLASLAREAEQWIEELLGPLFTRLGGDKRMFAAIRGALQDYVVPLADWLQQTVEETPPFELGEPDWSQLENILTVLSSSTEWSKELLEIELPRLWNTDQLKEGVADYWRNPILQAQQQIRDSCDAVRKAIEDIGTVDDLIAQLPGHVDGFKQLIENQFAPLSGAIDQALKNLQNNVGWKELAGQFAQAQNFVANAERQLQELADVFSGVEDALHDVANEVAGKGAELLDQLGAAARHIEHAVTEELRDAFKVPQDEIEAAALELTRALAEGPVTDALRCSRDAVGYYYESAKELLDVTRSSALFNDLGTAVLNALSMQLPFDRIRDRLLPQLAGVNVRDLLPDFGGLKLEHLLPELRILEEQNHEYDWVKLKHGFDKDRLTAWADVQIDREFDETPDLFVLPPLALKIGTPVFSARSRLELDAKGGKRQTGRASLKADWTLTLSGKPIVTIREGELYYDSEGGFDFRFDSENLVLAEELNFITNAMKSLLPQDEGLTITPLLPAGISAELSLPLPDIGTGAFTLTGVTLYTHFDLLIQGGFQVRTGLWLSRPDRPFGLAVLFLGGGGWFGADVSYTPPKQFVTRVSIGVSAGAFVALNFGVASGSAGILFTAGVDFYRDWSRRNGTTAVSLGLLVWGQFGIMGIASAYLRLTLRIEYVNGGMKGYGRIQLCIKICWCFKLRVNKAITKDFKKAGSGSVRPAPAPAIAALGALAIPPAAVLKQYADFAAPPIEMAVDLYFAALDVEMAS
ncbi:AAA family ATPase [Steroidobacter agaridevorans]|uniref:hypothetical protein n=1 Tax=Steroidobacter agaridevorans TaxID=2695856 RepID=UPI001323D11C|nr:hypothetical protein [Steroidobacter agaridevorans]GFE87965.1 hypothetical protein GCM10011488_29190 [Steroidobacter agaridevorans]